MTTVVLADDHKIVRQGLRALLSAEKDLSVVGEASDGIEAIDVVERLRPNVLVLDILMPRLDGFEVARRLAKSAPRTRIVVLSMHGNEAYVLEALRSGATAYVLKNESLSELVFAVREAAAGRRYLSPPFSAKGIEEYLRERKAPPPDRFEKLTNREREVFLLAAEGLSNPDIAERLFVSPRTVEDHRASMLRKLGLKGQTELVRYAMKRAAARPEA